VGGSRASRGDLTCTRQRETAHPAADVALVGVAERHDLEEQSGASSKIGAGFPAAENAHEASHRLGDEVGGAYACLVPPHRGVRRQDGTRRRVEQPLLEREQHGAAVVFCLVGRDRRAGRPRPRCCRVTRVAAHGVVQQEGRSRRNVDHAERLLPVRRAHAAVPESLSAGLVQACVELGCECVQHRQHHGAVGADDVA